MTPYALDGIARYGHGWQAEIKLSALTRQIAPENEDNLKLGDAKKIAEAISQKVRRLADHSRLDLHARVALDQHADDLLDVFDDPDDVRRELNRLYDSFDFYRICAT